MYNLLKNKNFLFLFLGRIITNVGDSFYYVAAMWFVFELGKSSFYTGLAGFLILLPQSLQFLTGPLVERWNKKKVLVITQGLQAILLLIISIMITYDSLSLLIFLTLMFVISSINQFSEPAELAIIPRIISEKDLLKGNSLLSFAYQGVDLAFNALAGVLIVLVGVGYLFYLDTITFIFGCLLFLGLKLSNEGKSLNEKPRVKANIKVNLKNYNKDLKEGFKYVIGFTFSKFIIGAVVVNFMVGATMANLPAYAELRGGPEIYGLFLTALFAGNLIGALTGSLIGKFPFGKLMIISYVLISIFWISSVLVSSTLVSILLFGVAWIPVGATGVIFITSVQNIVPDKMLARTMSFITSIASSSMPLGSLLGGIIGASISQYVVFTVAGTCFLLVAIFYLLNPSIRNASGEKSTYSL
ncbi:MFS transporter [Metabacillus indicus]|uniref:MFS transporter n=1 Tax=Metabacillus indicus TaxID=246786 RepID=UPI00317F6BB9